MKETHHLPNGMAYDCYVQEPDHLFEKTILYYHGGGLIYGTKGDVPAAFRKLFLEAGYTVVCMDYPLAPNMPLPEIMTSVCQSFLELYETRIMARPFLLAGRSGGAFLAFQLAATLVKQGLTILRGLVNFYGYTDLDFIFKRNESLSVTISQKQLAGINVTAPVFDDPALTRALLYFDAAQKGRLAQLYGVSEANKNQFALTNDDLKKLPKTFSAASITDEEVPFAYSKRLKRINPRVTFVPIYDLEHDFLKNSRDPQVLAMYQKLAEWVKSLKL